MLTTMWLARQKNRKRAIRWVRDKNGIVQTEVCTVHYADGVKRTVRRPLFEIFTPSNPREVEKGTSSRNSATCPVTGYTTLARRVEEQLKTRKGGAKDARLYCVVYDSPGASREFRQPEKEDLEAVGNAAAALTLLEEQHSAELSLLPNEIVPLMSGVFNAPIYGHNTWQSLFTSRQLLAITTYSQLVREYLALLTNNDPEYKKAVRYALAW